MANKCAKWCPKSCGKQVYYVLGRLDKKPYQCQICKTYFSKDELRPYNTIKDKKVMDNARIRKMQRVH